MSSVRTKRMFGRRVSTAEATMANHATTRRPKQCGRKVMGCGRDLDVPAPQARPRRCWLNAGPSLGFSPQQLKSVRPLVARETRNAPEHAQRLDRARRLGFAHVGRLPAELHDNVADDFLG